MSKALKFPHPNDVKASEHAITCTPKRCVALYNKQHPADPKKTSCAETVRTWFAAKAIEIGWKDTVFLKDFQTGKYACCVLFSPPSGTVTITMIEQTVVVLHQQ